MCVWEQLDGGTINVLAVDEQRLKRRFMPRVIRVILFVCAVGVPIARENQRFMPRRFMPRVIRVILFVCTVGAPIARENQRSTRR